jgi:hypothetical protein
LGLKDHNDLVRRHSLACRLAAVTNMDEPVTLLLTRRLSAAPHEG